MSTSSVQPPSCPLPSMSSAPPPPQKVRSLSSPLPNAGDEFIDRIQFLVNNKNIEKARELHDRESSNYLGTSQATWTQSYSYLNIALQIIEEANVRPIKPKSQSTSTTSIKVETIKVDPKKLPPHWLKPQSKPEVKEPANSEDEKK